MDGPAYASSFTQASVCLVQSQTGSPATKTGSASAAQAPSRGTDKRVTFEAPKTKHTSTETEVDVNLAETWGQAMEDGTRTVQSQGVKKTFFMSNHHRNFPIRSRPSSEPDDSEDEKVWETRMETGMKEYLSTQVLR